MDGFSISKESPGIPNRIARAPVADDALANSPITRRLGAGERLFVALRRFTSTNVVRVIALEGSFTTADVERALAALRTRHPLLRARFVDGVAPYAEHDTAPPMRLHVLERRDDDHWKEVLQHILETPMENPPAHHFEAWLLRSERTRRAELFFVGEHALCDGVSMNHVSGELVRLLGGGPPGPLRPTRPMLESLLPSFSPWQRARSFAAALARFTRVAISRAVFESRGVAKSSRYRFAELDREATARLVARARAERTTVTGAILAAVIVAVKEARPDAPRLALSVPINLRPRIPGHALSPADLANYTNATYLETRADRELWALARDLKAQLDVTSSGDGSLASLPLVYEAGLRFVTKDKPPFAHAMVSSSGIVPLARQEGCVRVLGFRSATSAPMISADFAFFCNTFDDRLCLNLLFSEEITASHVADRVLARAVALLEKASA